MNSVGSVALRFFRLTIKQLLLLCVLVAVAVVAMRYPDAGWRWLSTFAMPLVMATAVLAASAKGPASHWSRGFVVCLATYAAMLHFSPRNEMSPTGWLPTTRWLANCEPKIWSQPQQEMTASFPESEYSVADVRTNDRQSHFRTGHLLFGLGWALLGGRFACCLQD